MKTIVRLITFAALMVMPFISSAQDTVINDDKPVYRDTCVAWCQHLIGKSTKESTMSCDSIRWVYNDHYISKTYRVYVVLRGDHLGEYWHTLVNDTLRKVEYYDGLHDYTKRVLSGDSNEDRAARAESYYNKVLKSNVPVRQKTVQEAFWEAKLKEDMRKEIKKSK